MIENSNSRFRNIYDLDRKVWIIKYYIQIKFSIHISKTKNHISIEAWVAVEANIDEKHLKRDLATRKHQLNGLLE